MDENHQRLTGFQRFLGVGFIIADKVDFEAIRQGQEVVGETGKLLR